MEYAIYKYNCKFVNWYNFLLIKSLMETILNRFYKIWYNVQEYYNYSF